MQKSYGPIWKKWKRNCPESNEFSGSTMGESLDGEDRNACYKNNRYMAIEGHDYALIWEENQAIYTSDSLHPNELGHEYLSTVIEEFLRTL